MAGRRRACVIEGKESLVLTLISRNEGRVVLGQRVADWPNRDGRDKAKQGNGHEKKVAGGLSNDADNSNGSGEIESTKRRALIRGEIGGEVE